MRGGRSGSFHCILLFIFLNMFCHISNDQEGKRVEQGDRNEAWILMMQSHFTHMSVKDGNYLLLALEPIGPILKITNKPGYKCLDSMRDDTDT